MKIEIQSKMESWMRFMGVGAVTVTDGHINIWRMAKITICSYSLSEWFSKKSPTSMELSGPGQPPLTGYK